MAIFNAWLIEDQTSPACEPLYLRLEKRESGDKQVWTKDHLTATKFSSKEDATSFARDHKVPDARICEHQWG